MVIIDYLTCDNDNSAERWVAAKFRDSLSANKQYKCRDCGRKVRKVGNRVAHDELILHHIKPILYGGISTKKNLVILCNECHNKRHAELRLKPELPLFHKRKVIGYRKGGVYTAVPS